MKYCPNCKIEYFDKSIEFCLEDGMRLVSKSAQESEFSDITKVKQLDPTTDKTVTLPYKTAAKTIEFGGATKLDSASQTILFKDKISQQSNKALEITPFAIALAHNWWQWIYLNNQYYSSFTSYFLSANFLMWLLLLLMAAISGLYSLKRSINKGFAIASLVILSINLILFLVPKR